MHEIMRLYKELDEAKATIKKQEIEYQTLVISVEEGDAIIASLQEELKQAEKRIKELEKTVKSYQPVLLTKKIVMNKPLHEFLKPGYFDQDDQH